MTDSLDLRTVSYEDWVATHEKNIRPLPRWWKDDEQKKKHYDAFAKFLRTKPSTLL